MIASSSSRLRILFLANRVPFPIIDGQARRTYHILKGLAAAHDVHLLSMYETPEEGSAETARHLNGFCARLDLMPAPPKKVGLPMGARLLGSILSADPYTIWRHYSAEYEARVRQCVRESTYDVIHCDILPILYAIRGISGPFRSLTDHDVSYLKVERLAHQRKNPVAKLFLRYEAMKLKRLERRMFRDVDLVVTVSDVDRTLLEQLCPAGNFTVVENGVDVKAFAPDTAVIESESLVWVGGFNNYPNLEAMRFFLAEIYPAVRRACPTVTLHLVGTDAERLGAIIGNDSSIVSTGFVEDPVPFVQRAAVFIAPILSGSGTKLKVLEAMAAGKAIVATSVGVEGIAGRHGQHYLVADDAPAFARSIIDLLGDRARRERLGSNARAIAETLYDWTAICDKMSDVYVNAQRNIRDNGAAQARVTPPSPLHE